MDYCGEKTCRKDFCLLRELDKNCTFLGFQAASSGNSLLTFRGKPITPS